jgi:hypothetical protein
LEPRSRALRTAASSWPPQRANRKDPGPLGTLPAHGGLIRTGTADLIGLAFWRGKASGPKSPEVSLRYKPVEQTQYVEVKTADKKHICSLQAAIDPAETGKPGSG